jgi:hypothetical protein
VTLSEPVVLLGVVVVVTVLPFVPVAEVAPLLTVAVLPLVPVAEVAAAVCACAAVASASADIRGRTMKGVRMVTSVEKAYPGLDRPPCPLVAGPHGPVGVSRRTRSATLRG